MLFSQGKFKMRLKAQQMLNEQPICKAATGEKEGNVKAKPTTFNSYVNVKASVLCPTCDCEKVNHRHIHLTLSCIIRC